MAWIASDQSLDRDKRTVRLANRLDVDRRLALGLLHEIWHWAIDNIPSDGSLEGLSVEEIGLAIDWPNPGNLAAALKEADWLVMSETSQLYLADWWHIGGKYQEARQKDAERVRRYRTGNVRRTLDARTDEHTANVPRTYPRTYVSREEKRREDESILIDSDVPRGVQGGYGEHSRNVRRTADQGGEVRTTPDGKRVKHFAELGIDVEIGEEV